MSKSRIRDSGFEIPLWPSTSRSADRRFFFLPFFENLNVVLFTVLQTFPLQSDLCVCWLLIFSRILLAPFFASDPHFSHRSRNISRRRALKDGALKIYKLTTPGTWLVNLRELRQKRGNFSLALSSSRPCFLPAPRKVSRIRIPPFRSAVRSLARNLYFALASPESVFAVFLH